MDSTVKNKSMTQPKTIAELLPGLCGILTKDAVQTLRCSTAKKKPGPKTKPMTIAEMQSDLLALKFQSPRNCRQTNTSVNKKIWNSSTKNQAANGPKHNSVRKVLNFQTKPKVSRPTMLSSETPKLPKTEVRTKKSLIVPSKNNVRISGVCNIQETPVGGNKIIKNRPTLYPHFNKENSSYMANLNKKVVLPKTINHKKLVPPKHALTPLHNLSFKSNSDASFLEKEKEITETEMKVNALTEERTLENIAEVTPPVSTPFKEYRSVDEFFINQSENEDFAQNNDTIMCFDKTSGEYDNKREESVIVTLCDLFNKAKVTNTTNKINSTELEDLIEYEKQSLNTISMIENAIKTLNDIKESQLISVQSIRKLINEKKEQNICNTEKDKTLVPTEIKIKKEAIDLLNSEIINRPSVIKVKSPAYKIPNKKCLRKKVFHKSMPNISDGLQTPNNQDKALNMYMEMKEKMNFLNTPHQINQRPIPDTPGITSHNLQIQLDKLFNES